VIEGASSTRKTFGLIVQQLVSGLAEVFGAELAEGKTYLFGSECKAAIFTWQGCTLEIRVFNPGLFKQIPTASTFARHRTAIDGICV
jgi:hypothetical protein